MSPLIWPRLAATTIGALAAAFGAYGPTMINQFGDFVIVMLVGFGLYYLTLLPFRKRPEQRSVSSPNWTV